MAASNRDDPAFYLPDPGLVQAADVAIRLGMPLLLTGEPGVGKTQAASWLAHREDLVRHEYAVRSTSTASDLFYGYNALAHYHAAGLAARPNSTDTESPGEMARRFLTFHGLGLAILRAADRANVDDLDGQYAGPPIRSVVLLDEIDKAPRDLPNDILRAVETMQFTIPELDGRKVEASTELRPIVVVTSNSERNLPDAFLRRCIYYHIPFPDSDTLAKIVKGRLGLPGEATIADALRVFEALRGLGLRKPPATAELINLLDAMGDSTSAPGGENPFRREGWEGIALACLVKTEDDRATVGEVLKSWSWEGRK